MPTSRIRVENLVVRLVEERKGTGIFKDGPACGGRLEQVSEEVATTTDLPLNPLPVVAAYGADTSRRFPRPKRLDPR